MLRAAIPVLHVSSAEAAERFYCGPLGFRREFAYRQDPDRADPCYLGLDGLFRELVDRGVDVDLSPTDQTWGNREMCLSDPDGNSLRFVQSAPARATS